MLNYMLQFYVAQPSENRIGDFYISSAVQVLQLFCSSLCWRPPALLQFQHLLQYQRSLLTSALWLSMLIQLSQASTIKVEAPVISSASTASVSVAVSAITSQLSSCYLLLWLRSLPKYRFNFYISRDVQMLQLFCFSFCWRPPTLLQLQHLLQYQRSLLTSALWLSMLIQLSQASTIKVEAPVISSASTVSASVAVSAINSKLSSCYLLQWVRSLPKYQFNSSNWCRPSALLQLQHLLQYQLPIDLDTQLPIEKLVKEILFT